MNNQIRVLGLILVGLLILVWGLGVTSAQTLEAPTNLNLVDATPFSLQISWTDNATDESYYTIEFNPDGTWYTLNYVAPDSTEYFVDGLQCNTSYSFRVYANRNSDGSASDPSNVLTVSTDACPPPAAAPTNLTALATGPFSISLTWTDNATDESGFVIEEEEQGSWNPYTYLSPDETSLELLYLTCNTSYSFRIMAYRNADQSYSDYSNIVIVSTDACPPAPEAPSDFLVTSSTQFTATINWTDNSLYESQFVLERNIGGSNWQVVTNIAANMNSYVVTGLSCNTSYQFRLSATNAGGSSASVLGNSFITKACANPVAPTNLSLTGSTQTSVSLSWTDNESDETTYRVEYSANGTSWSQVAILSADTTSYTNGSLLGCSATAYFRVRAYRSTGNIYSAYSNVLDASTSACTPPLTPTNLTMTGADIFSVGLSWQDNATNEGSYHIERSTDGGLTWSFVMQIGANATSHTLTTENCNSTLHYRLRARHATVTSIYSDYSNVVSAVTGTCPPIPLGPTNFVITGSSGTTLSFSWVDNADTETSYRVERSSNNGTTWVLISQLAANTTSYTNNTMNCDTAYLYRIYAFRSGDNAKSSYSDVLQYTYIACAPSMPLNLSSPSKTSTSVNLTWTDNSITETGYRVERSSDSGSTYTEIAQLPADSSSYSDTSLNCNTNYRYRIRAYRSTNDMYSIYPSSISVTTGLCAPTNLRVGSQSFNSVTLLWGDGNTNESGYRVEKSSDAGTNWTQLVQLSVNATAYTATASCTDESLFRVYAYRTNDNSVSPYSNSLPYVPAPCAPTVLGFSSKTHNSINIVWQDNAVNETEYRLERSTTGNNWTEIAVLPANTTTYSDTGLNCSLGYYYRVRAYRSSNSLYSSYSSSFNTSTNVCPVAAPSNVMASVGNSWVNLSWTNNEANLTIFIEKSLDAGVTWSELVGYNNGTLTSHSDSGLMCEVSFMYRLRAARWTGSGNLYSDYSNVVAATTAVCPPPPVAPTNVTATTAGYQIYLTWQDNEPNLANYRIERSPDGGLTWQTRTVSGDATSSYSDSLTCSTDYTFRIKTLRTVPKVEESSYSNIATARSWECDPPETPSSLTAVAADMNTINLNWVDGGTKETAFAIERSEDGISFSSLDAVWANVTSYTNGIANQSAQIFCGRTYYYRVRAYRNDLRLYSVYSNVASATTPACPPAPSAPSNLHVVSNDLNGVLLAWTDNSSTENYFTIERSEDGVAWYGWGSSSANQASYLDQYTDECIQFHYRVVAKMWAGVSSVASNVITVVSADCDPLPPTEFTATMVNLTTISLSWVDNASGETYYELSRTIAHLIHHFPNLAANSTSFTDTTVQCGISYIYELQAYRSIDNSLSDRVTVTINMPACPTTPATPTNVMQTLINPYRVDISWDDNANNETNYRIERYDGSTWTSIANLSANSESYSDTTVPCGILYRYRISAYISEYQVFSDSAMSTYGMSTCAPNNLQLDFRSQWSIVLKWDALPFTSGYLIERSDNGGAIWQQIADISFSETSYVSSDLDCGTSYQYRVRGYYSGPTAAGIYSSVLTASTEDCYGITEASCTLTQIDLSSISGSTLGPVHMSANGSRVAVNYQATSVITSGLLLYDIASKTIIANFPVATFGDINQDGTRLAFVSSANPLGQNDDGGDEIFYWNNGSFTQLTNSTLDEAVGQPQISDDGSKVVFSGSGVLLGESNSTSYIYSWDATNGLRKLLPYGSSKIALSGDGSTLVFTQSSTLSGQSGMERTLLYRWNAADGLTLIDPIPFPNSFVGSLWALSINTDGSRIVFTDSNDTLGLNPDEGDEIFIWDEIDGLSQLTESEDNFGFFGSMDGTGNRILFLGGDDYDTDSTASSTIGNYFFDKDYGFSQITSLPVDDFPTFGQSLSSDGLHIALAQAVGWNGVSEIYPYVEIFVGDCTPANHLPAPISLSASPNGANSMNLTWVDKSLGETAFSLERSSNGGTTWTVIQAFATNVTGYTDPNLVCNTNYQYRLRAYRNGDSHYSSYSNIANSTTSACPAPNAPTGLNVTSTGQTSVNLAWTDNSNETQFHLERSPSGSNSWTEIAQPAANSTSYPDTTAVCNTSYDYRLRAYRSGDNQFSTYSNVATGTTTACFILNAPSNIQLTNSTQTSLTLSWTDNSTNESGYEIERSLNGTNWTLLSSLPANSTGHSDSGLLCSTGYQYRIRSNHLGSGTYSPYGTSGVFTTVACPALVASVLSSTGATINSISLSWTVDSSATSFTLAYYNGTAWVNLGIFPGTTTTYTQVGLLCGTNYPYRVTTFRAVDSASVTSSAFSTNTGTCPVLTAPNAPIVLNTEPALVSLQMPALPTTASSMSLERSTDGIGWTNLGVVSSNYLDTNVVCGSSYQYRLVAFRSSDSVSSTSATAVAFTDACPIPNVVGVYRNGMWIFVESNNTTIPTNSFNFGDNQWQSLVGDWDGDGIDGVGIYKDGEFVLRNLASADSPETRFNFGNLEAGWQAIVGDWNGDGIDSVGLYKDGLFILSDDNINIQYRFNFGNGQAGWQATAGDWDGNGADGIALYKEGFWQIANDVNNPDTTSQSISYGPTQAGWIAIVGDWNGDGLDSIGLYNNGLWRMRVNSINDATESSLNFGQAGDVPLAIFEAGS